MRRTILLIAILVIAMIFTVSCGDTGADPGDAGQTGYQQISQDEAVRIMEEESDYIIVDVRRQDEYAEGHIPGAINVPNENITDVELSELPNKDQILLVYCRSGNRSKEASEKLAEIGYTNVYEFGGIIDWKGYIVTEEMENMTRVTYDMHMKIGDTQVSVDWEDNEAVDALAELTAGEWYEIELSAYGGFEQVGPIGQELPSKDEDMVTDPGDIVLYSGDQIVLFYEGNSWSYTKLGHITDKTPEELAELLGKGDTVISIMTEYSE